MTIQVTNVVKRYATVTAVDHVSLQVEQGQILALLGPNGAGKSSLVRMLVGLTRPDSGELTVLTPGRFGYLPEDRGLYQDRSIIDNLNYIAKLRDLDSVQAQQSIEQWLAHFSLSDRKKEPMRQLSKGNQQKVQLIATLMHDPDVVILDEPFSGLDPVNQEIVLQVLTQLREAGKTVLLSAHQMALVERLADSLVLMNHGKVLAQGSLPQVRQQLKPVPQLLLSCAEPIDLSQQQKPAGVSQWQPVDTDPKQLYLTLHADADRHQLLQQLVAQLPVVALQEVQQNLHELYLQAVKQQEQSS